MYLFSMIRFLQMAKICVLIGGATACSSVFAIEPKLGFYASLEKNNCGAMLALLSGGRIKITEYCELINGDIEVKKQGVARWEEIPEGIKLTHGNASSLYATYELCTGHTIGCSMVLDYVSGDFLKVYGSFYEKR